MPAALLEPVVYDLFDAFLFDHDAVDVDRLAVAPGQRDDGLLDDAPPSAGNAELRTVRMQAVPLRRVIGDVKIEGRRIAR